MNSTHLQISKNLQIALNAMELAIVTFKANKKREKVVLSDIGKDIKLELDRNIEIQISDFLKKETTYSIIGEETGEIVGQKNEFSWVIDPIDGTYNFSRNLFPYCISIGLLHKGLPLLGVIYDIQSQTIFYGEKNSGAFANGKKINVSSLAQSNAALATGFPVGFSEKDLLDWYNSINKFKKVRMYGSACYSLLQVAQGKIDAYFEKGIFLWDVAAGLAIVEAAGGAFRIQSTDKKNKLNVYAGTSNFHEWFTL